MNSKLDMYILPIKAKQVLTRLEYRRLAPEELSVSYKTFVQLLTQYERIVNKTIA